MMKNKDNVPEISLNADPSTKIQINEQVIVSQTAFTIGGVL